MIENLSDRQLEKRIKKMSEKMISPNAKLAYGAAILYNILNSERERREIKKLEAEGKERNHSIFLYRISDEGVGPLYPFLLNST